MFKNFFVESIKNVKTAFKSKPYRNTFVIIAFFIFINALKLSLYNYFLIPQATREILVYKFGFTLLCSTVILILVLSVRSRYLFLIYMIAQGIYCFTNISYFLYYHSYLHFLQWISLFKEAMISATHLANPKSMQLLVVFIDAPLALYIFIRYFKKEANKIRLPLIKYTLVIVSLIILLGVETNNYYENKSIAQYMDDRYTGETEIVERYGTLANSVVNIIKNNSESKLIQQIHYGHKQSNSNTISVGNDPKNSYLNSQSPNFAIIQVESMDANIVRQQYKDSYIMPFLNSLTKNSIYYPYTLSYHQGGGTSDAEFSIINSVEPLESFPAIKLTSYGYQNSVISKLSKASYDTMAFHGNVGAFYNRNIALSKMGFQRFYDISSMNYEDEGWGAPDDKVFSFALDKMKASGKPFVSYVITMTSHGPFESARNYYNNPAYDDIDNEIVKNYFNSFSYVDESIRDYVSAIQKNFPNTYVIIYGDHTPNINSEDFAQASFIDGDKYFEFVPMIVITPDKQKYTEKSAVASFLDVSPTILEASGLPYSVYSDGSSLITHKAGPMNIPLKGSYFDRAWLYDKISNYKYAEEEPLWKKYLPSFISSNLIEKHRR
ncbi:lipoteichoic acid synthase 2 [Ruminiclostridium hungatei]|uniref:Lipoteichoic acid synthase 2 n=1 Tax=Ruminiclostridium hungatei TaxID=48256 RepID=A0A1V4SKK8_RUMHU|nr:LTA synthase family protein [Ruminiclostridium hungatei]OPX43761.1 lipoteichoic acid synthase 2 [Ruminiclostridium hungatei]